MNENENVRCAKVGLCTEKKMEGWWMFGKDVHIISLSLSSSVTNAILILSGLYMVTSVLCLLFVKGMIKNMP